jgi:hypothetical protein
MPGRLAAEAVKAAYRWGARLIGTSILDPQAVGADDEPPAVKREWSDAELNELGDMLVRGLSIEEIARLLRRDHDDVQNKVVEIGRACR